MKGWKIIISIIISLIFILFLVRAFSPRHLDDVSPAIPCERELLEKSDYLSVIPFFENFSISENKEWCEEILAMNKTLVLHGIYHTYREFEQARDENYLQKGKEEFVKCFGFQPEFFKAPQLSLSRENKKLLESKFKIFGKFSQLTHKAYHCEDSGKFPNWLISLF